MTDPSSLAPDHRQLPLDISDSLAYRVHRLARLLRKHFLSLAEAHGLELTPEQWFCLNKLRLNGELNQTALTDEIFADRANMTRILARLEKHGWVERARDPQDARCMLVRLSAEGERVHDTFASIAGEARLDIFADIPDEQLQATHQALVILEQAVLNQMP